MLTVEYELFLLLKY